MTANVFESEGKARSTTTSDPVIPHSEEDADASVWIEPRRTPTEPADRGPSSAPRGRNVRRKKTLAIGLAVLVLTSVISWWTGRQIRSPAEVAAHTAAPAASLITVPIEERVLTSEVITRGTVRYGSPLPVLLPRSVLKQGSSIVTTAPAKGAALHAGDVAMTMSGRPVFILQGAQPTYRDLGRGDQGTDVRQLQEALTDLGFDPGPVDGRYDSRTASAVAAWYQSAGWAPFGPTPDQQQALRSAQGDLFTSQSDRLAAEQALATARSEQAAAGADLVNKQTALNAARDAASVAALELADASAASPPPSASELAALRAALNGANGAVAAAQADLGAANANVAEHARAVDAAQRLVNLGRSRNNTLGGQVGDLATRADIQVPADEVLFFPSLPLRVDDVSVAAGEEPAGPVMTVSSSALAVDGALSAQDAKLVRAGATVTIDASDLGVQAPGTVTAVADQPGTQGVDPQRFYLQVTPADAPDTLVGASVVLTITVGATDGKALTVPVAALWVAADGKSRVEVRSHTGATRAVTVRPGLAAKGMVAVAPLHGRLAAGDLVVVGRGGTPRSRARTTGPGGP